MRGAKTPEPTPQAQRPALRDWINSGCALSAGTGIAGRGCADAHAKSFAPSVKQVQAR
jgi:hypothetical protein